MNIAVAASSPIHLYHTAQAIPALEPWSALRIVCPLDTIVRGEAMSNLEKYEKTPSTSWPSITTLQPRDNMCDWEEFIFSCDHSIVKLKSYCHSARNDPNHLCFGVKVLRNSWRQGIPCEPCFHAWNSQGVYPSESALVRIPNPNPRR